MMRTPRRQRAFDLTDGRCIYCNTRLCDDENVVAIGEDRFAPPAGQQFLCVTLMTPKAAGGRATALNEVPACHGCSARKGILNHGAFIRKLEREWLERDAAERSRISPEETWQRLEMAAAQAIPMFVVHAPPMPPRRDRRRTHDARSRSF